MVEAAVRQQGRPLLLVAMLLATGLLGLVPSASAASGDLSLVSAARPTDLGYVNVLDATEFAVEVTNEGTQSSPPRAVEWEACPTGAPSGHAHCYSGSGTVPGLAASTTTVFEFPSWTPSSSDLKSGFGWTESDIERNYSLTFAFEETDFDPSDDVLAIDVVLTKEYANVEVHADQDPRDGLVGLGLGDNGAVMNTNVTYPQSGDQWSVSITTWLCDSCGSSAPLGWRLFEVGGTEVLAEANTTLNLETWAWGGQSSFTRALPAFSHNASGVFDLEFGLLNASSDLNPLDNLRRVTIELDDTSDLVLSDLTPTHNTEDSSAPWYYGEDALQATVENTGKTTLSGLAMNLLITDIFGTTVIDVNDQAADYDCTLPSLAPGDSYTCLFDLLIDSDELMNIRVSVPSILMVWPDVNPEDNVIEEESVNIIPGPVGASISQSNSNGIYTTQDTITMIARTAQTAAQPVNYTWYLNGLAELGFGQVIEIDAGEIGIGVDYQVSLIIRPAVGDTVSLFTSFDILQYVPIEGVGYSGGAISADAAVLSHEQALPLLGENYYIGNGKEPLMIHSFSILDPSSGSDDVGLVDMRIRFNLTALLPSNINATTVELRLLDDISSPNWDFVDYPQSPNDLPVHHESGHVDVVFRENVVVLFIGVLPKPDVAIENVDLLRRPAGHLELAWNASGDLTNPYLAGWNIYRITAPSTSSTYFPSPELNTGTSFWQGYTETTYITSVPLATTSWFDPVALETGFCSSYLLAPADRSGASDLSRVAVSHSESDVPGLFCGDAVEPLVEVINFRATSTFTNETACYQRAGDWNRCYEVDLTWTWPDHEPEGPVTWDLYWLESDPSDLDLGLLSPIVSQMVAVPGEEGTFHADGFGDYPIRPYRTYYYVLAPTDAVGNPNTFVNQGSDNIVRVHVDDEWWDYNQHLIPEPPPEPEPPLGSPWVGEFMDKMNSDTLFQTALGATLACLVVALIMTPALGNKRKRLKRIIMARARRKRSDDMADDLDDFF